MKYWVAVISKDHALAGAAGGFVQASQGTAATLGLLRTDDLVFFYSPGTRFRAGEILQAFTGIARVTDDAPHRVDPSAKTLSWRLNATALACEEAPIEPLIPELDFIEDKASWSRSLPRGMFEIGQDDAHRIADAMKADIAR